MYFINYLPKYVAKKNYQVQNNEMEMSLLSNPDNHHAVNNRSKCNFNETYLTVLSIIYLLLCESSLKMFNCQAVDGKLYLWNAGDYQCYTFIQYAFMIVFAIFILFPFYVLYLLWKAGDSNTRK
eukprot:97788_1